MKNIILLIIGAVVITSCATKASGVAPVSVSYASYTYLECEETTRTVPYKHLRAHETVLDLVCRLLLEKKKK